jgi:hypothetical protein
MEIRETNMFFLAARRAEAKRLTLGKRNCVHHTRYVKMNKPQERPKTGQVSQITSWFDLYRWAVNYIDQHDKKLPYNKVIADFAEYVVCIPDTGMPDLASVLSTTANVPEMREFSPRLVALAGRLFFEKQWPSMIPELIPDPDQPDREACLEAIRAGGLIKCGLFRLVQKGYRKYLVGTPKLKRRYGIEVKLKRDPELPW